MIVTVLPMAWRWQKLLAGRGIHDRLALADARVLHRLHGRPGAADLGRRRRDADLRDDPPPPRPRRADRRVGAARAGARRRGDARRWPRSASCSRSGTTTSARTSGSSSASSSPRVVLARRALLASGCAAPLALDGAAAAEAAGREAAAGGLRGDPRLPRPPVAARRRHRAHARRSRRCACWRSGSAAKAVGVDLSPRVYYVMGPLLFLVMLVPFTINGLAVREAFFVSFLDQARRQRRRGVRDRVPLLRRHDRARAARAR